MDYICFVHADMSYRNVECRQLYEYTATFANCSLLARTWR